MARSKSEDLDYADIDRAAERHDQLTSRRAYKLPEGMSAMKTDGEEEYMFDHLPYTTTANPMLDEDSQGKKYHELTYWIHGAIGPDRKPICCPRKNWDKPCPVCELQEKLRAKLERNDQKGWEATSQYNTQERQIFCVLNRMGQRPKVMIYENSYAAYGERLKIKVNAGTEKNGFKRFLRLDGGKTIRATFTKQPLGQGRGTWLKCTNIEMEDRDEPIPVEVAGMVPNLEEMLIELSYDQISELLYGKEGERDPVSSTTESNGKAVADKYEIPRGKSKKPKDDDEPAPKEKTSKTPKDDRSPAEKAGISKGDFVWQDQYGRCEVIRISGDGTALTLMDESDESHSGVDPEECKTGKEAEEAYAASQEPEEPAPKEKTAKKAKGGDWGDDKPPTPKKSK